jgi:glutathione S-transferase
MRTGLDFDEIVIPLDTPGTRDAIAAHSPTGKVPVLRLGDLSIWDSLAICEYLAETVPEARLWPAAAAARATARAVSAEMHSGFMALRQHLPMNVRAHYPDRARRPQVDADIARITALWRSCREDFGGAGDFLFGPFTIADAMYAPVVSRFRTYGIALPAPCQAYAEALWAVPEMQHWAAAARDEPFTNPKYDF